MFCKFCGSRIAPNDSVCPKCRRVVTTEDGNGFWDMAGEPRRTAQPELEESYAEGNPGEPRFLKVREPKKTFTPRFTISTFVCFLCLTVLLVGQISNRSAVRKINSDYASLQKAWDIQFQQLEAQQKAYDAQIQQLGIRIASLEAELSQRSEDASDPIQVIHAPSDEDQTVGFRNNPDSFLFRFQIDGTAVSFLWEKQLDNGDWSPLDFHNQNKMDARYGLRLDEDTEDGISTLIAAGLTKDSGGIYRCTVTTEDAEKSVTVNLVLHTEHSIK